MSGSEERGVLEGFPRIGYDVHLSPFPGSLSAYLKYVGDPCDYGYIMGVSGAAFRRLWNKDDGGNIDLMHLAPEPYRRILDALGYEYKVVPPRSREEMTSALKESITRGRPVLAFGIIGPPECGVVTGFDKGGEVAIGYSYFQDPAIPGYYEQPDWFETSSWSVGLLCIGEKSRRRPSEREVLVSSLRWAVDLARTPVRPECPNHLSGLAACDGWADGMEADSDYQCDPENLFIRLMIHGDQCVMIEERREAARFLRMMSEVVQEFASDLTAAADLYEQIADSVTKQWPWQSYDYEDLRVQKSLSEPSVRREIARQIRIARQTETEAIEHLEKALAAT